MQSDLLELIVEAVMYQDGLTYRFMAGRLGVKGISTLATKLGDTGRGGVYGTTSSSPHDIPRCLERTAVFLYALGVEENHQLIGQLRREDIGFLYPPPNPVENATILAARTPKMVQRAEKRQRIAAAEDAVIVGAYRGE